MIVKLLSRDHGVLCVLYDDFSAKAAQLLYQHSWIEHALVLSDDGTLLVHETDRASIHESITKAFHTQRALSPQ